MAGYSPHHARQHQTQPVVPGCDPGPWLCPQVHWSGVVPHVPAGPGGCRALETWSPQSQEPRGSEAGKPLALTFLSRHSRSRADISQSDAAGNRAGEKTRSPISGEAPAGGICVCSTQSHFEDGLYLSSFRRQRGKEKQLAMTVTDKDCRRHIGSGKVRVPRKPPEGRETRDPMPTPGTAAGGSGLARSAPCLPGKQGGGRHPGPQWPGLATRHWQRQWGWMEAPAGSPRVPSGREEGTGHRAGPRPSTPGKPSQ